MNKFSRGFLCLLGLALLALPALGGDLLFRVDTAQGKPILGALKKLAPDWSVELDGAADGLIPGKEVLSLRRSQVSLPAPTLAPQFILAAGDRIPIDLAGGVQFAKDQFQVRPTAPLKLAQGATLSVPSAMVAALWLAPPAGVSRPEAFMRKLLGQPQNADAVLLQNGDRVDGIFLTLDSKDGCKIKVGKKSVVVPFDRIAAVVFNNFFLLKQPPAQPYGHLVLAGGGRLSLLTAALDAGKKTLTGKTLFQAEIQVPLKDVLALDIYQGRAVYLSDLKPKNYSHTPFFGVSWPLVVDAGIDGAALRLGGDVFDKGLAMHTGSQVSYNLGGQYDWFEAVVGLADGSKGRANIRVLVDGKPPALGGKGELTWKDQPLALRIAVHQAKQLTLHADYAAWGDVQGHVQWANARLLKK